MHPELRACDYARLGREAHDAAVASELRRRRWTWVVEAELFWLSLMWCLHGWAVAAHLWGRQALVLWP